MRTILLSLALICALCAHAQLPAVTFHATDLAKMFGANAAVVAEPAASDGRLAALPDKARGESYNLRMLKPGWYRFTLRVRTTVAPPATGVLSFALWNPNGRPNSFRYETTFLPQEFPPVGQLGELTRVMHVGEMGDQYGMLLQGGWVGLQLDTMTYQGIDLKLKLEGVRPNKLLYALKEAGTVAVAVQNGTTDPQPAHLTVTVAGGLDAVTPIYDADITVPAPEKPGQPALIAVPLPAQAEYGHAVTAVLKQGTETVGTVSEYYYVSDRPQMIGHFGSLGIASRYSAEEVPAFVEKMRRHYFPLYEVDFWAPDDVMMLTTPPGKDRWWSGQTLGASTTESMKTRVRLGQEQGMKVLGYTDLRYDYGFRIAEFFRQHPEYCDWDANDSSLAYNTFDIRRQTREDDTERFEDKEMRKPRFGAEGIWGLATGNPDMVDYHINQLVEGAKEFGFDGWRYDDAYSYDYTMVDLLGRQLPYPGFTNPVLLARLRAALDGVKPGMIYGHNMEWAQDARTDGPPMSETAAPRNGDYYTEFLRDGGLHLQERWSAYIVGNHERWDNIAEWLWRSGYNAYRFGGACYSIAGITNARPVDARYLVALYMAGMNHVAYDVQDDQIGYMRLATRFCDLLYGDHLVQLLEPEKTLTVDAGGKPVWWKRYVRYREVAPGHRQYIVHLINPPRNEKLGEGDPNPPDPLTNVTLRWSLPAGWKVNKAYTIAGEGGTGIESAVAKWVWYTTTDIVGRNLVQAPLPGKIKGTVAECVVPSVGIWSMVVLDCTGPKTDVAPAPAALPPLPAVPAAFPEPPVAKNPISPNGMSPLVYTAPRLWQGMNAGLKQVMPQDKALVADGAVTALQLNGPLTAEFYSPGEVIKGGTYRFSFRLRATLAPPDGATLEFSAWCPGNRPKAWRLNEVLPLTGLTPDKGWQTLTRDVQMGYGWENFGIQLRKGFAGLQIAEVRMEAVQVVNEAQQLAMQGGKPWPTEQKLVPHDGLRIWYGDGLYSEAYRLTEALKAIDGVTVDQATHWVWRDRRGFGGTMWKTPQELAAYDLIILANIDLKTLTLEQRDWLRGYVTAGGALWLIGGPYGFGRGYWHESDLLEPLIPVKMHPYDLRPAGVGKPLPLANTRDGFLKGKWMINPTAMWVHETEPKAGATTHILTGKIPALVTWETGQGRVAALTVTPLGDDGGRPGAWWKSSSWPALMEQTARWLLKK